MLSRGLKSDTAQASITTRPSPQSRHPRPPWPGALPPGRTAIVRGIGIGQKGPDVRNPGELCHILHMTQELREGRNQVHSSHLALAQGLAEGTACECRFSEGRKETPDIWTPKVLKKTEGSLRQREEDKLGTSVPANSIEAGNVGNLDTNILSRDQGQNPTSLLTSHWGVWGALGRNPGR